MTKTRTDPRVDVQVNEAPEFARPVLRHLRELVHAACPEVEETIKWGRPFFLYQGKMVCAMASFQAHCSFRLWEPEIAEIVREAGFETSDAAGTFGRITKPGDLPPDEQLLGWLRMAFELAGREKPVTPARAKISGKRNGARIDVPEDLAVELAKRSAAEQFAGMSPSCRREYIGWIEEAKRAETRVRRVMEAAGWISEGKRRNWKYEAS